MFTPATGTPPSPPGTVTAAGAGSGGYVGHGIRVVELDMDDCWFRDTCPTFAYSVEDGRINPAR